MTVHEFMKSLAHRYCSNCRGRGWRPKLRTLVPIKWQPGTDVKDAVAAEWVEEVCPCVKK